MDEYYDASRCKHVRDLGTRNLGERRKRNRERETERVSERKIEREREKGEREYRSAKMSEIDAKVNMSLGKSPKSQRSNGFASNPG